MNARPDPRTVCRVAFAVAFLGLLTPAAEAALTVMVNGVIVATERVAGDELDTDTGVVQFIDTVDSHQIRLTPLTDDPSQGGPNVVASDLSASGDGGLGTLTRDGGGGGGGGGGGAGSAGFGGGGADYKLRDLNLPNRGSGGGGGGRDRGSANGLRNALTRNRAGGLGSSATARVETAAPDAFLGRAADADATAGLLTPPGGDLPSNQVGAVTDPFGGDGLTVPIASEVPTPPVDAITDAAPAAGSDVIGNPAPPGLILLAAGLPVVGLYRRRLFANRSAS